MAVRIRPLLEDEIGKGHKQTLTLHDTTKAVVSVRTHTDSQGLPFCLPVLNGRTQGEL